MTKEEIFQACQWDELDMGTLDVYSDMFERTVEVRFLPDIDSGRVITDRMVAVLNDFLALTPADLAAIKQFLWQDCLQDFEDIDYGNTPSENETYLEVNQREFGIYTAEDAYAKSNLTRLSIPEEPELKHRYGAIDFEPEWASHGCSVIMQDGRLIDSYSNDWYFSKYEPEEE